VADPVKYWKAVAYKGNILIPCHIFSIGVCDQKIHRFVFNPLVEKIHVSSAAGLDINLVGQVGCQFFNPFQKGFSRGSSHNMNRHHVNADEKLNKGNQVIRIACQGYFFMVEIGVHISDDIQKLPPFKVNALRHVDSGGLS